MRKTYTHKTETSRRKLLMRYVWAASYFMGIGLSVAMTVLACIWLGQKADERFGTEPKGTLAGIFLGFPVAIYSIYHQVRLHFFQGRDAREKNGDDI